MECYAAFILASHRDEPRPRCKRLCECMDWRNGRVRNAKLIATQNRLNTISRALTANIFNSLAILAKETNLTNYRIIAVEYASGKPAFLSVKNHGEVRVSCRFQNKVFFFHIQIYSLFIAGSRRGVEICCENVDVAVVVVNESDGVVFRSVIVST